MKKKCGRGCREGDGGMQQRYFFILMFKYRITSLAVPLYSLLNVRIASWDFRWQI